MAETTFVTYRKFDNPHAAGELVQLLSSHEIPCVFEDANDRFDPSFAYNHLSKDFRVKLDKSDFPLADEVVQKQYESQLSTIAEDYYLFGFTEEELIEVLVKRDEWSQLDFVLARKILKDRGYEFDREAILKLQNQRLEELAVPEEEHIAWVIFGYIVAVLGGLLGFIIGLSLLRSRKTLPNGERVFAYSENNRRHGRTIVYIGIASCLLQLLVVIIDTM